MLVCPQCQFENPNTNKFCQKCGTSLSHKFCHICGTKVALSQLQCHNCGTETGQIWWAIISQESGSVQQQATVAVAAGSETPQRPHQTDSAQGIESEAENPTTVAGIPPYPPTGLDTAQMLNFASEPSAIAMPEQVSSVGDAQPTVGWDIAINEISATPAVQSGEEKSVVGETDSVLGFEAQGVSGAQENPLPPSPSVGGGSPANAEPRMGDSGVEFVEEADNPFHPEYLTSDPDGVSLIPVAAGMGVNAPPTPAESTHAGGGGTVTLQAAGGYLDYEQRYQLLEPVPARQVSKTEVEVRVLDCQPLQMSPLAALVGASAKKMKTDFSVDPTRYQLPAIARPYVALQLASKGAPFLHDAWQQNGLVVLLLSDRSQLPRLVHFWSDEQITSGQIWRWLQDMTELWALLEPWQCRSSLLELENMRVDADGLLCMQRLYAEDPQTAVSVQNLGQLWQRLFRQSERTHLGPLVQLLAEVETGEIETVELLRARLEAIAPREHRQQTTADESYGIRTMIQMGVPDDPDGDDTPTMVLPRQLASLEAAGRTDIGRQRTQNEDDFGIETKLYKREGSRSRTLHSKGLYILCDGMGGHEGGEVASGLAVDTLRRYFQTYWKEDLPTEDNIRSGILLANQAIYDLNQQQQRSGSGRMGTTLVMVLLQDTKVAVAHVGDSRLYRLRAKRSLEQVTVDHEVGQREMSRGVDQESAYARPDAYQLTQALGPRNEDFVKPDIQFLDLQEDSLLILASDGLTDNDLLENHWQTHLEPLLSADANLEQGVDRLIDLANQYNGHDNITAIGIRARVRPNPEG